MSHSLLQFVFPPNAVGASLQQQQIVALTESSNHLRDLRNKLRLVQRQATALPAANPVPPMLLDDRLGGTFTRTRKSFLVPMAPDRIRSEVYPIATPPHHDFKVGQNSRYLGRDPVVMSR